MAHGKDFDSSYRLGLMVKTWTHGIVKVLLKHTHTRGPSVAHMRDFFILFFISIDLVIYLFSSLNLDGAGLGLCKYLLSLLLFPDEVFGKGHINY